MSGNSGFFSLLLVFACGSSVQSPAWAESHAPRMSGSIPIARNDKARERKRISDARDLARRIATNTDLDALALLCKRILAGGFEAGSGYPQVWIRDFNTFLEAALQSDPKAPVRQALLKFFEHQGANIVSYGSTEGNIPDTYDSNNHISKNTAETDQETSLVQAVGKYVTATGDKTILDEVVNGRSVRDRMADALMYPLKNRYSEKYGLIWGATTADWGDNQPEDTPGATLNENSHPAIDVYDNAMLVIALRDYIELTGDEDRTFTPILERTRANIRKHLWDGEKFMAHLYLEKGSPFPASFDESAVFYHGGTAVAIEADLLDRDEVLRSLRHMRENVAKAGAQTIGLNQYPPYPDGLFQNPVQTKPYTYQNAGDWPWFGARIVRQAIRLGLVDQAYFDFLPMVHLFLRDNNIYEWYSPAGVGFGSPHFRGAAGQVLLAINELKSWAAQTIGPAQVSRDCNHQGESSGLFIGRYALADLMAQGISNDDISSLKVEPGYRVTLYENDNFEGTSLTMNEGQSCLPDDWNDRVSSLIVEPVSPAVTVFKDCNFMGRAVHLPVGDYTLTDLLAMGISNDDISSLQVAPGFQATLYTDDIYFGSYVSFDADAKCLVEVGANDVISSLKVRKN